MGYDATNYLPKKTKKQEVEEFLELLGYKREDSSHFYCFEETDYKHICGILAHIIKEDNKLLKITTHTRAFRSKIDAEKHNWTIKQLKDHFGGYFISDCGRNKYFPINEIQMKPAEAGCALAYSNFGRNIIRIKLYTRFRVFKGEQWKKIGQFEFIDEINPNILSNNMLTTYMVATLEDYFKSTYIALLKYSDKRAKFFKNIRFQPNDLVLVSNGDLSIEQIAINSVSFQNLKNILHYFKILDDTLDLSGILHKPFGKKKISLIKSLDSLIQHRHKFIHHNLLKTSYIDDELEYDIQVIEDSVTTIYKMITDHYGWEFIKTWG